MLAADRRLADVAGDQVHPLDLRDRHLERLGDGRLDQSLAEADAHLAGDHLDHEPRRPGVEPSEQSLQRSRLGRALRAADRLQGCCDLREGTVLARGAALERVSCPVAQVRVLAKELIELPGAQAGDARDRLAQSAPAQPERAALRRSKGPAGHEDRGAPQVIVIEQAEIVRQDAGFLERRLCGSDRAPNAREFDH